MVLKIDKEVEAASLGTVEQLPVMKEALRLKTHKELNEVINSVLSGAWPRRQAWSLEDMLQGSKTELMVQE